HVIPKLTSKYAPHPVSVHSPMQSPPVAPPLLDSAIAITLKKSGGINSGRSARNQSGMLSAAISTSVGARTGAQRGKYTIRITAHMASNETPANLASRGAGNL